ncbi:MAG: sugar-transfer associated ATP-grasp domain-containing protein [Desulfomicrobium sp.]|nr:sugar-transfer associated ATP-grasp domain-containing protein [Desulfomicrobium sp.]
MFILKKLLKFIKSYLYHFRHKKVALSALKQLDLNSTQKLSVQEKRQIDKYAQSTFGHKKYAPWLYVYSKSGRGIEGCMPDNYYGEILLPALKGFYGQASSYKPLHKKFFTCNSFPDLGSYINGLFLNSEYEIIPPEDMHDYLFSGQNRVVYKIDNSQEGKGVYIFNKENFSINKIKKLGNGVFQYFIEQHEFFNQFHKESVATIRVTSFSKNNGDIEMLAGYLQVSHGPLDFVKADNAMKVDIDVKTGVLSSIAHFPNWQEVGKHPDTGIKFQGLVIPEWDKVLKKAKMLHQQVPFVRCIGWDMAIDKNDDVIVMEWNGYHNGITYHEFISGPIFKNVAAEI